MSWTYESINEAVKSMVSKAETDAAFRQLCLDDIQSAAKEVTGQEIPAGFKIQVVDGTGYQATVVLPEAKGEADELSETELESVAGGSKGNYPYPTPGGDTSWPKYPTFPF
jgi:hypothetical protein